MIFESIKENFYEIRHNMVELWSTPLTASVELRDFCPFNHWEKIDQTSYIQDQTFYEKSDVVGKKYYNETKSLVRKKLVAFATGGIVIHAIALIVTGLAKIARLLSFHHFRKEIQKEELPSHQGSQLTSRLKDVGKDMIKLILAPVVLVAIELSALYGLLRPYDGRKLVATIVRAYYGFVVIAPCFQGQIQKVERSHLFSKSNEANNW